MCCLCYLISEKLHYLVIALQNKIKMELVLFVAASMVLQVCYYLKHFFLLGFYTSLRTVVMMDLIGIAVLPQLMAMTFPLVGAFQLISISTSGKDVLKYQTD